MIVRMVRDGGAHRTSKVTEHDPLPRKIDSCVVPPGIKQAQSRLHFWIFKRRGEKYPAAEMLQGDDRNEMGDHTHVRLTIGRLT